MKSESDVSIDCYIWYINWHQITVLSEVKRFINQYNVNFSIKFAKSVAQGKRRALRNGSCLKGQISLGDYCVYNYSSKFFDNTQDMLASLSWKLGNVRLESSSCQWH